VQATDGNFYGTTVGGGAYNCGTVFKITPTGTLTTLYSFDEWDGDGPQSSLIQGTDGNFYGTTSGGGAPGGQGTVFKITPGGMLTTLHTFDYMDGALPFTGLVQATDGNFYGTTDVGGANSYGTVFKITPGGTLTTLYSFDRTHGANGATLMQATDGNFYGTTLNGGATNNGTVFKIAAGGTLTTLDSFCSQTNCADGANPEARLVQATDGTFYGTTSSGGTGNCPNGGCGTVFSLAPPSPLQFVPVTPCRLVDTRDTGGPIPPETGRDFAIPQLGGCNIPSTAAAYSLNVTAMPYGPLGYLAVYPTGSYNPYVSTLNSNDGRVKANAAIMPAGVNGAVTVWVTYTSDVLLDINGYFAPPSDSTLAFYPLTPCRVADTRNGQFLPGGQEADFPISGVCNAPASATAYSLNLTVVPRESLSSLTVWPAGQPQPSVANLYSPTGTVVANAALVGAGADGKVAAYPSNDTDLIIDIDGYYAPANSAPGGLSFYPVMPCRALDTRETNGPFWGHLALNVVGGAYCLLGTPQALVLNTTVVPLYGGLGYLALWPDGQPQPLFSILNSRDEQVASNMAIVATDNGWIDAYATSSTQLILDVTGYFAP